MFDAPQTTKFQRSAGAPHRTELSADVKCDACSLHAELILVLHLRSGGVPSDIAVDLCPNAETTFLGLWPESRLPGSGHHRSAGFYSM